MAKSRIAPNEDEIHSYLQSAAASGELAAVKIPVGFEAKAKADRAAGLERDTQAHALRANTLPGPSSSRMMAWCTSRSVTTWMSRLIRLAAVA